jgi:hypothetical protein
MNRLIFSQWFTFILESSGYKLKAFKTRTMWQQVPPKLMSFLMLQSLRRIYNLRCYAVFIQMHDIKVCLLLAPGLYRPTSNLSTQPETFDKHNWKLCTLFIVSCLSSAVPWYRCLRVHTPPCSQSCLKTFNLRYLVGFPSSSCHLSR